MCAPRIYSLLFFLGQTTELSILLVVGSLGELGVERLALRAVAELLEILRFPGDEPT